MHIIAILRTQFDLVRAAVFSRAGTLDDLLEDARRLQVRALLVSQRNNDKANELENQRAALEAEIARLDAEADEADLIAVATSRLLGE